MPIYEYHCADCRRRVSRLVMRISDPEPPHCPRCQGTSLTRLMSRFATLKSEEDRLESLADPSSLAGLDENDPKSVARFMKKMGGELGEEGGEDWDQMVDEAMAEEANAEPGASAGSGGDDDL
jgi:putative FmdB family regulatory protein